MYPHERSLVKRLADAPFVLLGINSDQDKKKLHAVLEEQEITWPSFWNGPEGTGGPISSQWNVLGWPTIYILDHRGVIRFKSKRGPAMDAAVDELLAEIEADGANEADTKKADTKKADGKKVDTKKVDGKKAQ